MIFFQETRLSNLTRELEKNGISMCNGPNYFHLGYPSKKLIPD